MYWLLVVKAYNHNYVEQLPVTVTPESRKDRIRYTDTHNN